MEDSRGPTWQLLSQRIRTSKPETVREGHVDQSQGWLSMPLGRLSGPRTSPRPGATVFADPPESANSNPAAVLGIIWRDCGKTMRSEADPLGPFLWVCLDCNSVRFVPSLLWRGSVQQHWFAWIVFSFVAAECRCRFLDLNDGCIGASENGVHWSGRLRRTLLFLRWVSGYYPRCGLILAIGIVGWMTTETSLLTRWWQEKTRLCELSRIRLQFEMLLFLVTTYFQEVGAWREG